MKQPLTVRLTATALFRLAAGVAILVLLFHFLPVNVLWVALSLELWMAILVGYLYAHLLGSLKWHLTSTLGGAIASSCIDHAFRSGSCAWSYQ